MNKGRVKLVGSPADLASCSEFVAHSTLSPLLAIQNQDKSIESCSEVKYSSSQGKECYHTSGEVVETVELEERKEGKVELVVYRSADSVSGLYFVFYPVMLVLICLIDLF